MMDVEELSGSFLLSVVVLLLVFSCKPVQGTLVVNVTQSSYQAEENHNITLEWTFTTTSDSSTSSLIVVCELINDHSVRNLFHLFGGIEVPESQDQQFVGRVQWDKDVLREGRVRLHVSRLGTEDSGRYRCKVRMKNELGAADSWLSVKAAADESKLLQTTIRSHSESRGAIGLFAALGLTAAALLAVGVGLYLQLLCC